MSESLIFTAGGFFIHVSPSKAGCGCGSSLAVKLLSSLSSSSWVGSRKQTYVSGKSFGGSSCLMSDLLGFAADGFSIHVSPSKAGCSCGSSLTVKLSLSLSSSSCIESQKQTSVSGKSFGGSCLLMFDSLGFAAGGFSTHFSPTGCG
jgi:hypothetical protein